MNKEQFTKSITYLGIAYNKKFTQQEVETYYEFLKEYDYETLKNAIKKLVKENKFIPSISEIITKCEESKQHRKFDVLERMKKDGYFKSDLEYDKAIRWLDNGIIPSWFKEDMKKYNQLMIENKKLLLSE